MPEKLSIVLSLLFLVTGCCTDPVSWQGTYTATLDGTTGRAKVYVAGSKVRMEFQNTRKTTASIIRYDKDIVWLLAPTIGKYTEIPALDLRMDFPLFFDPRIQIEKTALGRESIHGIETIKYSVQIYQGKATFKGLLWEAVPPWPVPVKWEGTSGEVAIWEKVVSASVDPALFEVPPGLARLEQQEPQPP